VTKFAVGSVVVYTDPLTRRRHTCTVDHITRTWTGSQPTGISYAVRNDSRGYWHAAPRTLEAAPCGS